MMLSPVFSSSNKKESRWDGVGCKTFSFLVYYNVVCFSWGRIYTFRSKKIYCCSNDPQILSSSSSCFWFKYPMQCVDVNVQCNKKLCNALPFFILILSHMTTTHHMCMRGGETRELKVKAFSPTIW